MSMPAHASGLSPQATAQALMLSFAAAAGASAEPAGAPPSTQAADRPPNIVFIMADDLGYRELGCYGQEKIQTPNIDRLAAEGMRFTQCYSPSPVCAPTRCCLMTGRHTGHAIIRGNKEVGGWGPEEPEGQWPLPDDRITIAEILRQHGYATGAFGKWGLGGPGSEGHPNHQGFDRFYGYLCQRVAHSYYPTHLWRNHDVDVQHGNRYFPAHQRIEQPFPDESDYDRYRGENYAPEEITGEAVAFIHEHKDEPFFLYFPSIIPHVALQAPPEDVDRYPREWDPEPYLGGKGYLPTPRPRATYAAMISHLDDSVGRLLATIEALGLDEETIVFFTSDNGTTYAGGADREFFNSLGELRGTKGTLFEGGIRVPLIVRWPGRIEPGSISHHVAALYDVLPTFADLLDADVPPDIDGLSFAPTLLGAAGQNTHDYLYWEYPERDKQQAARMGRYKALRRNLNKGNVRIELYDLVSDPGEQHDIAGEHPRIVAQMRRIMDAAHRPSPLFPIRALDEPPAKSDGEARNAEP